MAQPPKFSAQRLFTIPGWKPELEEVEPPLLPDSKHCWFDNDPDAPSWYCFAPNEQGEVILWRWVEYPSFELPANWVPWTTNNHPATKELLRVITEKPEEEPVEVEAVRAVEWFNGQQDTSQDSYLVIDRESGAWSLYQMYKYGTTKAHDSSCIWDSVTDAMAVAYCKGVGWGSKDDC